MRFINIGFENMVSWDKVVAIVSPDSAPIRRLVVDARDRGVLIDATCGRRTRAVIITDSGNVVLSIKRPETIAGKQAYKNEDEQDDADVDYNDGGETRRARTPRGRAT
ncbi:MAG: DUF370 domain-containing protein [Oscillospiraceae bacterium]|jgi:regulator of extracellular matrix RemA (YlzA/DUF370 family)|nr:DUF370 domain-containing protein [Oscillospiraceae bacterium]